MGIDFILDEQSSEENYIEKAKRPNRTIAKSLEKDDERNSIIPDSGIKNRKVESDETNAYQNENSTTLEEEVGNEMYLNEVNDKKVESESHERSDNTIVDHDLNSENEVSNDEESVIFSSDNKDRKESSSKIVSNSSKENITDERFDDEIDFANTIEPEAEHKIKKSAITLDGKTQSGIKVAKKDRNAIENNRDDADEASVIDSLPDYQDEDNNIIGDEEQNLNVKSQPLSKSKEKQTFIIDENSSSRPTTFKNDVDRKLRTTNNFRATNGSVNHKNFATTTKDLLNSVQNEKFNSGVTNTRNKAVYDDDDKINELGKDPVPVLLNQRARRHAKEIINNVISFAKTFLNV